MGRKWADLVSLSTITQIAFFLEAERVIPWWSPFKYNLTFKWEFWMASILQRVVDTQPWLSDKLNIYPHTRQFLFSCYPTKKSIALNLDTFLSLLNVLNIECCGLEKNIFSFRSTLSSTHNWFWILSVPSSSTMKPSDFSFSRFCLILCCLGSSFWWDFISSNKEGYTSKVDNKACVDPCETNSTPKRSRSFNTRGCLSWMAVDLEIIILK